MNPEVREILKSVEKPFRYIGGEVGSVVKGWGDADVRICLVFPEVYEIGMSHLGLSILYHIINGQDGMLAERVFAPWIDMESELIGRGVKLFSLESRRPVADFDILGISLAYELTYTNVVTILKLGGIPIRASERIEEDPIVIAGGPCTFNPEPVASFFDAIAIGDGETLIVDVARVLRESKNSRLSRADTLFRLRDVDGIYVPNSNGEHLKVKKAFVSDLDQSPYPAFPIVPYRSIQNRLAVEVSRGCARGCRFCQAGYIYRPVRNRSGDVAVRLACDGLASTGQENFSFLSLSVGDWQPLERALDGVHRSCGAMPVDATLPSLRVESLTGTVAWVLGKSRSGGFTLAPEAASERMRRFINKGNTDEDLYASVEKVFGSGWHSIKLYFMLGLPGETDDDVEGIVRIANRCLDIGRRYHRRPTVTVSTSTFVPKAHTPFQWDRQISIGEARRLQAILRSRLRRPGLSYRWHNPEQSFLEGVFSRGGRELAGVVEAAHRMGARFDGWDERFDFKLWQDAFAEEGLDPCKYLESRGRDFVFPWEGLDVGPSRVFLLNERERADGLLTTQDCTKGPCSECGICDFVEIKNRLAPELPNDVVACDSLHASRFASSKSYRYRLRYTKEGRASYLGHLEVTDAFRMALRAAGLPLGYSEGFHPRVKVSMGPALAIGFESAVEFLDIELTSPADVDEMPSSVNLHLPEGLSVVSVRGLGAGAPSIDEAIESSVYEIDLSGICGDVDSAVARFKESAAVPYVRKRKKGAVEVDLKAAISDLAVNGDGMLKIRFPNRPPAVKVAEILEGAFGMSGNAVKKARIRKTDVRWRE